MLRFPAALVLLALASTGLAAPLPEPVSYAKPTPGDRFVLVAFGSPEAEAKLKGETKRYAEGVRAKYPVSGMYRGERLVYPLDGYAPDDNVYLTGDGRYVIRIEGDWWKTKAYTGGVRLPAEVEQKQLDALAISFFEDGKLLKSHPLKSLITHPVLLSHSPEHILWVGGAVLREDEGQFVLFTQDTNKLTFDFRTGEILGTEKTGYGSRFGQTVILVTLGLTLLLLLGWAFYAFRGIRTARVAPVSASPPAGNL